MDRFSRQKISKDQIELNSTINQLDIIDIYRIFHPTIAEYTFLQAYMEHSPSLHGAFTKINHIQSHKIYINEFKRIQITQYLLSYHSRIKLEISNNKNSWKKPQTLGE